MKRFCVVLTLILLMAAPVWAKDPKPNRLLGFIGTASTDLGDLTNYQNRSKQYGGTFQLDAGEHAKLRVDVSRDETLARSWLFAVGPQLHLGPVIIPLQGEYSQASSKWAATAGAGFQLGKKTVCFEAVAKVHQGLNQNDEDNLLGIGRKGEPRFYSLQLGAGFTF